MIGSAQPHPSPTAATSPAPTATPKIARRSPLPYSAALASPTPLSPAAQPSIPAGRSKTQRWTDSSLSPSSGERAISCAPSFRDVVASMAASVVHPMKTKMTTPPRIILHAAASRPSPERPKPDEDGWTKVQGKQARKDRMEAVRRPRRPVPEDLRGRCFNCLSFSHRVATCRRMTRCLRCLAPGHQVSGCPLAAPAGTAVHKTRRPVWRRISPPAVAEVSLFADVSGRMAKVDIQEERHIEEEHPRRRARRRGRRSRPVQSGSDAAPPDPAPWEAASVVDRVEAAGRPRRRMCIIDRSESIARAELDLRRGLLVTITGSRPAVSGEQVIQETARAFGLDVEALQITKTAPEDFLLILPNVSTADRVLNGGRPVVGPEFSFQFKRWSRLVNASCTELPVLVDVELRGVPAHAWDKKTAAQLLGDSCWICSLHQDTVDRRDLTAFKVSGWCTAPELVLADDLFIPEPTEVAEERPSAKRGLLYPIETAVVVHGSPPQGGGDGPSRRQRRRRRPAGSRSPSPASGDRRRDGPRGSVHARLGPVPMGGCHVERTVGVAGSQAPSAVVCANPGSTPALEIDEDIDVLTAPVAMPEGTEAAEDLPTSGEETEAGLDQVTPPAVMASTGPAQSDPSEWASMPQAQLEMGGGREIGPERGVEVLACVSDPITDPPLMMAPPSLAEEPCPTPRRTSEEVSNPAGLEETPAVPPTQWLVYSRRRPARVEEAQGGGSQPAAEDFISRITKTTTTVNAPPPIPKRRKKVLPPDFTPVEVEE
ncbi:hypothetical protein HU200_024639 [Digitaria exilis]|uniref:CCHC-type domain-containing protein n=1 Tax=Digitaria exilis TaxID=1010633 RepID=A0A835C3A7_9POAL|nr:hypothetical protein HU200_024639 [Digitaria exilis]